MNQTVETFSSFLLKHNLQFELYEPNTSGRFETWVHTKHQTPIAVYCDLLFYKAQFDV
jgi:hypothetical protein